MRYILLGLALALIAWAIKHWRDIANFLDMVIFRGDK